MSPTLVSLVATVVGGALAGGITNIVAIWMLFRPHQSRGIGPFRIQGAIPKNKARLAKSIGKTVGQKLLTPGDIADRLSAPPIRSAFDDAMQNALAAILEREHASLRSQLGPEAIATIEDALVSLGPRVATRIADYAASPDFEALVASWSERLRTELGDRQVGAVLTPARRELIAKQVDEWSRNLTEGAGLERTLRGWLADQLASFEGDDRPLGERLPAGLLGPVEQAITDALPTALDRLGDMLGDPVVKSQIRRALREAFDTAGRDLLFHERLIAKLVVTDKALARLVDGFEGEGFDRLVAAATAPEMRARVERAVQDALNSLLHESLGSRLRRLSPERRAGLEATVGDWLVSAARSEATRSALRDGLVRLLDAAGEMTWEKLLRALPPEQAAGLLREAIAGEQGQAWLASAFQGGALRLLDRPIGRPAAWLGEENSRRLAEAVSDQAWEWVQGQVPIVVGKLDVQDMVEQKILAFPTPVMEDIIKRVIEKELHLIVQLGWLLGAIVGLLTFALSQVVG